MGTFGLLATNIEMVTVLFHSLHWVNDLPRALQEVGKAYIQYPDRELRPIIGKRSTVMSRLHVLYCTAGLY